MAIFINNSNIGFNGALPGRTIETDDQNYIDVLIARGFEQIEAESPAETAENKKPKTKKIQTEIEPQNPPAEPPADEQNPPAEPPADEQNPPAEPAAK